MVDSVYRTRSLGVGAQGLPDQYADGQAAKVWEYYIGSKQARTDQYKNWLSQQLRDWHCQTVLDVACGTGVDSAMLTEEGFRLVSTDASDKMLKYALKERWNRRKEPHFDSWVIEEANWMTLEDDLHGLKPGSGFDAVICLGNSFAHLPDFEGNQSNHKVALSNFYEMLKPGGVLLIDHRNYDEILATGKAQTHSVYYNSTHIQDIKCSNLYVNARPTLVTLDYTMDIGSVMDEATRSANKPATYFANSTHNFRLSYYPHCLGDFSHLLKEIFGPTSKHQVQGDFRPLGEVPNPAYYIHSVQKPTE